MTMAAVRMPSDLDVGDVGRIVPMIGRIRRHTCDLGISRGLPADSGLKINACKWGTKFLNAFESTTPVVDQDGDGVPGYRLGRVLAPHTTSTYEDATGGILHEYEHAA